MQDVIYTAAGCALIALNPFTNVNQNSNPASGIKVSLHDLSNYQDDFVTGNVLTTVICYFSLRNLTCIKSLIVPLRKSVWGCQTRKTLSLLETAELARLLLLLLLGLLFAQVYHNSRLVD